MSLRLHCAHAHAFVRCSTALQRTIHSSHPTELFTLLGLGTVLVVAAPLCRWAQENNTTVFNSLVGVQIVAGVWAAW